MPRKRPTAGAAAVVAERISHHRADLPPTGGRMVGVATGTVEVLLPHCESGGSFAVLSYTVFADGKPRTCSA